MEELEEDERGYFNGYVACCLILAHECKICHDVKELIAVVKSYRPDVVFWIVKDYTKREVDTIAKMRQHKADVKVVITCDFEMYLIGAGEADYYITPASIVPDKFRQIIHKLSFG
jgi:two-component SAPR family response regulator